MRLDVAVTLEHGCFIVQSLQLLWSADLWSRPPQHIIIVTLQQPQHLSQTAFESLLLQHKHKMSRSVKPDHEEVLQVLFGVENEGLVWCKGKQQASSAPTQLCHSKFLNMDPQAPWLLQLEEFVLPAIKVPYSCLCFYKVFILRMGATQERLRGHPS